MVKISVVVPVYNVKRYLEKCIKSILTQTLKSSIDIILVDDGSTDGSGELCDFIVENNERVFVVHKPNGGLSDARNAGLDYAFGNLEPDYIAFVDSDDFIHPQTYEIALDLMEKSGADMSAFYYEFVQPDEIVKYKEYTASDYSNYELLSTKEMLEKLPEFSRTVSLVSACMKLYKSKIFRNLRFGRGFTEEDSLILPYVLDNSESIARTKLPLYFWATRQGSISRSSFNKNDLSFLEVSFERMIFFQRNGNELNEKYFEKEFMNRCVYYKIRCLEHKEVMPYFRPYKSKYTRCFFKNIFSLGFCKAELIMHISFMLNIPLYKKLYIMLNPDCVEC